MRDPTRYLANYLKEVDLEIDELLKFLNMKVTNQRI